MLRRFFQAFDKINLNCMTIKEAIQADIKSSSRAQVVGSFSKSFRIDMLSGIIAGDEFVIPEDYEVLSKPVLRGGEVLRDQDGNAYTGEYIKVMTKSGEIKDFYPTMLTKVAFRVDPETGKDVVADRIVRTSGDLVSYVKSHPDMNETMQALKGCTIKCVGLQEVPTRTYGVSNENATKKDVVVNKIGEWTLVGAKKPANWAV